ncbi:TetR/AcrR family transcriptional regulator [Clavibacter michiganensis]|uniref:TetR family transcriptional regulator n=2 Tax=Clavibacter michiganensis subsp. insidiosus TaxID=33014 RepID=A0A0D5CG43_9MICO|nr:TetR/AcrR family transcriptional regulator [Clavibacter michiganensis]AJW78249.1 TetR family transcriptional regulator [Clavibacter michiganensis subsp. insidiosus]AWF99341.1 TetR family transcriptional regulator [Clavibacter michiganensis subsp. insidiosus]AWG00542.1 TetR family transcriptional regulator [Clavibacter michiganensis subsp. insidiosus]OQJ60843.1 TetR family transcriptional regulator [Clavibacter michiganensis subsp. insidiosus]RII87172.1 TetR family transcriptional regulator 
MTSLPSARAPRKDAATNRQALVDAAVVALDRDPDASLETIAAAAGLSRRAVYGHFATRDDLVREVLRRGARRIVESLAGITHPDGRIHVALIGARLWAEVEQVRVMARVAVRGPLAREVGTELAPLRAELQRVVERGIAAGELRGDIPAPTLARLIEGGALAVLDEATRSDIGRAEGHSLVILTSLALCGLDWRAAGELIAATPELREAAPRVTDAAAAARTEAAS